MLAMRILAVAIVLLPFQAWARPVSYAGGWTVMQMHNRANTSIHLHYSPTAKYSIGFRGFHARDKDVFAGVLQANLLVKRFNKPEFQANFYLKGAAGAGFDDDDDKFRPAGFAGVAGDWENRRLFVRYENRARTFVTAKSSFMQSGRVGIAPYLGDYGSLHTWIMLEASHYPGSDYEDKVEITPLARFFKGSYLLEAGWSISGKLTLNFIRRF